MRSALGATRRARGVVAPIPPCVGNSASGRASRNVVVGVSLPPAGGGEEGGNPGARGSRGTLGPCYSPLPISPRWGEECTASVKKHLCKTSPWKPNLPRQREGAMLYAVGCTIAS